MNAQPEPQNLEAEEYVLGALMLSSAALDAVQAAGLDAADFYRESHARIYRAAQAIHNGGGLVDALTITARLEELGQLTKVEGGRDRIREIATLVPVAANAPHWARLVIRSSRLRRVASRAHDLHAAATAGGNLDELEQKLDTLARALLDEPQTVSARYRVTPAAEFLDSFEESPAALVGQNGETLLPAGGLLILGGEAGSGKTTLALDAVAHLAAGTPWLNYPVNRPLRILIIENEGPRAQFREKLKQKADAWEGHNFIPNIHVWEEPWARFSFANQADRQALRETTTKHQTDLVMCDPLDSLGIQGAGTPEDTRTFVQHLRECGLHNPDQPLAFWILHHFGKQEHGTIVNRLRGAWGDHADAVLGLEQADGHASKLTWGKLRHATPPAKLTAILAWDVASRGFTLIDNDAATQKRAERLNQLAPIIHAYVTNNPGQSTNTITRTIAEQHHCDRTTVEQALKQHPSLHPQPGPRRAQLWHPGNTPHQLTTTSLDPPPVKSESNSSELPQSPSESTSLDPTYSHEVRGGSEVKSGEDSTTSLHQTSQDNHQPGQNGSAVVPDGKLLRATNWVSAHLDSDSAIVEAELLSRGLALGEVRALLAEHAAAQFEGPRDQ